MTALPRSLRLGTRGSRLAIAQSRQLAAALQNAHPGLRVKLVTIRTPGDRDLDTPLSAVQDSAFFSADIDAALLAGHVDFAVHSRKDLEETRPRGIVTAAIPPRANPREAVLFHPAVTDKLARGECLRIGTSSPRRARNVAHFLRAALPRLGPAPKLECLPLRGPVDQRLARLQSTDADALDGIVLALAGLERLWLDPAGRAAMEGLMAGVRWMVLPLADCPGAPGQGALAVECRAGDTATRRLLRSLHDSVTAAEVQAEFAAAADLAPQQRSAFAATAVTVPPVGRLLFVRGLAGNHAPLQWPAPPPPAEARAWVGGAWHRACRHRALPQPASAADGPATFAAHWRAVNLAASRGRHPRTWVSGWPSWKRLSAAGLWVEGCADGLGFDALRPTLATAVLQLPPLAQWLVLTRAGAEDTWQGSGVGKVIGSYTLDAPDARTAHRLRTAASQATHFFWSSREQYLALRDALPATAEHACGTGKTYHALTELGVQPRAFPNREAWQTWLG